VLAALSLGVFFIAGAAHGEVSLTALQRLSNGSPTALQRLSNGFL
jgi:hypothetical protein